MGLCPVLPCPQGLGRRSSLWGSLLDTSQAIPGWSRMHPFTQTDISSHPSPTEIGALMSHEGLIAWPQKL